MHGVAPRTVPYYMLACFVPAGRLGYLARLLSIARPLPATRGILLVLGDSIAESDFLCPS